MKRIGIRELRQEASKHLREVENGETIEVTDRGRLVARIVPVRPTGAIESLIASGRMTPGRGNLFELGPPLPPTPGLPLPSKVLATMREEER